MSQIAEWANVSPNVLYVLSGILLALCGGSAIRIFWLRSQRDSVDEVRSRLGSLGTWWILFLVLVTIVLLGRIAAILLFGICSLLGLREYQQLQRTRFRDLTPWRWAYAVVAIHYLLIYWGWLPAVWTFIPVFVLLLLLAHLALKGDTAKYVQVIGVTYAGLMLIIFLLSHGLLLLDHPERWNANADSVGMFVYLVLLTELNDISQALIGRSLGRRRIVPQVSPGKTWEGFLGGATITVLVAVLLAPWLTPFETVPHYLERIGVAVPYLSAVLAGLLIAIGGFLGDLTFSAIKREVGAKDSGTTLPGQGGILDRIDSLTFTGPLFFYYTLTLIG